MVTTQVRARQGRRTRRGGSARGAPSRWIAPVVTIVVVIALWQLVVVAFGIPDYVIASPVDVGRELVSSWDMLMANLWPTALETVLGFLLGNVVAILIAVVFVHWKTAERSLFPLVIFVRTVPIVAVAPILVVIFGTGYLPKILVAALISFFPTLVNMVRGLEAVQRQTMELLRVLSATRRETFFKVRLYTSLPYLFSSLKISATSSVIGAVVGEWVGAQEGLGYLIIQSTFNFNVPLLYATMVVTSVFATLFFLLIGFVESRVVTWAPKTEF